MWTRVGNGTVKTAREFVLLVMTQPKSVRGLDSFAQQDVPPLNVNLRMPSRYGVKCLIGEAGGVRRRKQDNLVEASGLKQRENRARLILFTD